MENKAWVIRRPATGRYRPDVLKLEHRPVREPASDEVLVRSLLLSLDPSNLMWLKLQPGWMEQVKIGDIIKGPSIAVVEQSNAPGFACGNLVVGALDWSTRSVASAAQITKLQHEGSMPLTAHLTIFSHVGRAAMIGMRWIGAVRAGETVLVSAAAGATGMLACEIGIADGARVIGIAGGAEKCAFLREEVGVYAAIDYRNQDVIHELLRLCPAGPDLFFDNVGGALLDSLLPHLAVRGRIAICGQISQYAHERPEHGHRFENLFYLFMRRLRMEGFVVPDFAAGIDRVDAALADLYARGLLTNRPHVLDGLQTAAVGLEMLLTGSNRGKLMVQVEKP